MKNDSGVCCWALKEKVYIEEEHRGDKVWTFVVWLFSLEIFALFSVSLVENSLCWPLAFACCTCKIVTDKMASPLVGNRDSPNAKGLLRRDVISLSNRLFRKGSRASLRTS